jgi:hypothetical protein
VLFVAAVVVAGAAAALVALRAFAGGGTSAQGSGPTEISILPSPGTRSACIVGAPGLPRPTLTLRYGTLQGNTYSVPTGTVGHVGMCYDASNGSLFAYANWSHVGAAGGWFSYPQVACGVDDYLGPGTTYTNQSPAWAPPQTVATTVSKDLWVTTSYTLRAPPDANVTGYDLSLDEFFSEGLPPTIDVPPFVEVEIFLAHNIGYPFSWVRWSTLTLVNTTLAVEPWDVAYWCHGADNGTNGNVSFDFSYGGQSTHGLADGTLGVDLSALLREVEALMPGASCWSGPTAGFSGVYLGEEDLGSEDGAVGGASFTYSWTVTQYCLHTQVDPYTTSAVACGGTDPVGPAVGGSPSWSTTADAGERGGPIQARAVAFERLSGPIRGAPSERSCPGT